MNETSKSTDRHGEFMPRPLPPMIEKRPQDHSDRGRGSGHRAPIRGVRGVQGGRGAVCECLAEEVLDHNVQ